MTTEYTTILRLAKPDFRDPGWSPLINGNMDALDQMSSALFSAQSFTAWANSTAWTPGIIALDLASSPSSYWICAVPHTSAVAPTTFAQDRAAHPSYWLPFFFAYRARGAWAHLTQYLVNDIAYDSSLGITGICKVNHISNSSGTINDDATNWDYIVNLPSSIPADAIPYDNSDSGLSATTVQDAIDELALILDGVPDDIADVQADVTALQGTVAATQSNVATNTADILLTKHEPGDVVLSMRPTAKAGWAVCNDGTIGNGASGATLYANALASTLFTTLWNGYSDVLCPVSGGRGANAAADFAASKTIGITKMLGRALIAAGSGAGLTARPAGTIGGVETVALAAAENGPHTHGISITTGVESANHSHGGVVTSVTYNLNFAFDSFQNGITSNTSGSTGLQSANHTHLTSGTSASQGSGTAHTNVQPFQALYAHIRLY